MVLHGGAGGDGVCTCGVQALFVQNKRASLFWLECPCVCLSAHASECPCVCVLALPRQRSGCPRL